MNKDDAEGAGQRDCIGGDSIIRNGRGGRGRQPCWGGTMHFTWDTLNWRYRGNSGEDNRKLMKSSKKSTQSKKTKDVLFHKI